MHSPAEPKKNRDTIDFFYQPYIVSEYTTIRGSFMRETSRFQNSAAARQGYLMGTAVFALLAIGGLYYVKWNPYYSKALVAAAKHSIGGSILSAAAAPPAPSLQAAWDYTVAYTLAIWKAMILGLLLGSAVQALGPRQWRARLLGKTGFASVALAGTASVFSMM